MLVSHFSFMAAIFSLRRTHLLRFSSLFFWFSASSFLSGEKEEKGVKLILSPSLSLSLVSGGSVVNGRGTLTGGIK